MLKLLDNPPVLYPDGASVDAMQGMWWVAHTKPRCEKAFAWDLATQNIGYFLPLMARVTYSGGRKRHGLSPLFPSYVFMCGGADARHRALLTGRLCQIIPVSFQEQLVRELSQVERVLRGEAPFDPYPFAAVGRRCRVRSGPFEGVEGIVIKRTTMATLVLQVSMLGQGISLQIDTDLLDAAEAESREHSLAGMKVGD